jgi:hypothetical protein
MLRYTLLRKALSTNGVVSKFDERPFVLSSPLFGRIEGLLSLNCGFKDKSVLP